MATIYTSKGIPILVDDSDYEWLNSFKWTVGYKGYATASGPRVSGRQTSLRMHRLIMDAPAGMLVDHINHNRADNRRSNLHIVTAKENQNNLTPQRKQQHDAATGKWWLLRGHDLIGIYDTQTQLHEAWMQAEHGRTPKITNTEIPY